MDLNKLTTGDRVIAISGIVLFIFSFFDWLGAEASAGGFSVSQAKSAWNFTLTLIAVLIGIAMVVIVALKAFDVKLPDLGGTSWSLVLLVMGVVAFAFVLIKLDRRTQHRHRRVQRRRLEDTRVRHLRRADRDGRPRGRRLAALPGGQGRIIGSAAECPSDRLNRNPAPSTWPPLRRGPCRAYRLLMP